MKFTLTNALLVIALLATVFAWQADRRRLGVANDEQERRDAAAWRTHRPLDGMYFPHSEEFKLRGTLERQGLGEIDISKSADALRILAVHKSYSEFDDKELLDSYVRIALLGNNWRTPDDLIAALAAQHELTKDLASPEDPGTRSLTQFLERLCKHRDFRPAE